MIKYYTASGLTANVSLSPSGPYAWRLLSVVGYIVTGGTAGTRTVVADLIRNGLSAVPLHLSPLVSSTLTAGYIAAIGDVALAGAGGAAAGVQQWSAFPVVSELDDLEINYSLIAGDLGGYVVALEELIL